MKMDQSQRWRNLFSSVSHIKIGVNVDDETIKALAIAAKNVENKRYFPAVENPLALN